MTPAIWPTAPAHTPAGKARTGQLCWHLVGAASWEGIGHLCRSVCPGSDSPHWAPTQRKARAREQPAPTLRSREKPIPTCTVDHTGRLDGAVLCLHCRNPPHPKVIRLHTDASHRAVLDDLGERGAASKSGWGSLRALAPCCGSTAGTGAGAGGNHSARN